MRIVFGFVVAMGMVVGVAGADGVRVFVSVEGNDGWSGKIAKVNGGKMDGPVRSLERAKEVAREMKKSGEVEVVIQSGEYYLEKGLRLAGEDSGVTWRGEGEVRLIGGKRVEGFKVVTEAGVLEKLAEGARGKVLVADLKGQGIGSFGEMKSRGFGRALAAAGMEVFFGDRPMTLARWPNEGFVKIAGIPQDKTEGDGHGGKLGKLTEGFYYEGDRPGGWKNLNDAWVHGYWAWDWANSYERVASIDVKTKLVKTAAPYGMYGFRVGQRIYFLNVLEELDEPGEWYLDRVGGKLYFWPPGDVEKGRVMVSVVAEPVISVRDATDVVVRGVMIECTRGNGIEIVGGERNSVAECGLRNIGNYGVIVRGGKGHRVEGCEISYAGDGGIDVSGGDRKTLTPGGHVVYNNHIHHVGRWSKCYVPAIHMNGVGNRAANNLIHDHPHCAILFGGNEHVVELNEIHHVALETGDVGAIYTGRDYSYRGNVIRHNYVHHTGGVGMGSMGVYMDDCVSGTLIEGNVFWKVQRAVFLGGGRDFRVENNVFVDCRPAVQLDGRGMDKSPVWHGMVYSTMKKRLEDVKWKEPPYRSRYPEMAGLEKYYVEGEPGIPPENILVARNVCVGNWLDIGWHAKKETVELKDNVVGGDVGFVDAAGGNFQLKEESAAYKVGFKRIPMESIGLVKKGK